MRFVAGNDPRGLFPKLVPERRVTFRRKGAVDLLGVHRRRSRWILRQIRVHIRGELLLILFHAEKFQFVRIHRGRPRIGIHVGVLDQIGLKVGQTVLRRCRRGQAFLPGRNTVHQFPKILLHQGIFLSHGGARFGDHPLDVFEQILVTRMLTIDDAHDGTNLGGGGRHLDRGQAIRLTGTVDEDRATATVTPTTPTVRAAVVPGHKFGDARGTLGGHP